MPFAHPAGFVALMSEGVANGNFAVSGSRGVDQVTGGLRIAPGQQHGSGRCAYRTI